VLLLGLCVGIIAAVAGGGGSTGSSSTHTNAGSGAARLNTPVRDGKFEFNVKSSKCGARSVGGEFGETAQGRFCIVKMTVKNIGNESATFDASSQFGFSSSGKKFTADTAASIADNASNESFLDDINRATA
jgi:hypothetical protein